MVISGRMIQTGQETIKVGDQEFEVNFPVQIIVEGAVHGNISTMSGGVTVNGNAGNIKTMSGDVDVRGTTSGNISTMSGDVTCKRGE